MYPFGQDITYVVDALVDDSQLSGIPAHDATLYVFEDKPSRDNAQSGTGALLGPVTKAWTAGSSQCTFTIPAINDPDADSNEASATYYVAINFLLKTAGQIQTSIRPIQLERVILTHKPLSVTLADLSAVYKNINIYTNTGTLATQVAHEVEILKSRLKGRGYQWANIYRHDALKLVVVYNVLSSIFLSEVQQGGEEFLILHQTYSKKAESLLEALVIEYSSLPDEEPTKTDTAQGFAIITI